MQKGKKSYDLESYDSDGMGLQNDSVAIIGGGFAGVAVLAHLVERSTRPLNVYLIEKTEGLAKGVAFGTECPDHPLNVPAIDMGMYRNDPAHFYKWLLKHENEWRNADPAFSSLQLTPHAFLPRKLYGIYLRSVLAGLSIDLKRRGHRYEQIFDEAIDLDWAAHNALKIQLKNGSSLEVDKVILAIGVPPVQSFPFEDECLLQCPRYVKHLFNRDALQSLQEKSPCSIHSIVLIGSGLTAIDALFSLKSLGYQGSITVLSKFGLFPKVHVSTPLPKLSLHPNFDHSVRQFLKNFKEMVRNGKSEGLDWRQFVDALRPFSSAFWSRWSIKEKKRILRHLLVYWNMHRHRMSPESELMLESLKESGRLKIFSGMLERIKVMGPESILVEYLSRATGEIRTFSTEMVINCSGLSYAIKSRPDPFVKNLLAKKFVEADELGLGFKLEGGGALAGLAKGRIYALGSPLWGELFETTAVAEIRKQAFEIAAKCC